MAQYDDLTDLQLSILGVLWARKRAGVTDIHAALKGRADVSRMTVATLLLRLERRGMVKHRTVGGENIYEAIVRRRAVLMARIASVLGAMLDVQDDPASAHALRSKDVAKGDVARVRALLRQAEKDIGDG